jgi:mRNA turnover protein 4
MPKSKKEKKVSLTQVRPKDRDHKSKVVTDVREAIDSHNSMYLFSFDNMRSNKFKDVRVAFRDSKIFMGKNKLLQLACGRSVEDEYAENLKSVSKLISGSVGLMMTSRSRKEVEDYFRDFKSDDFARAGAVATETVLLKQSEVEVHPVSMVEQFRKLGVPVEVKNGKVSLFGAKEFPICSEGDELSVEQCKLLVHFGYKLSTFSVKLVARWEESGDVVEY